jgi:hypothetical protein
LLNISGRVSTQSGGNVGIGGFIVSGSGTKKVILRAIGPSMQSGGKAVNGRMDDPFLELRDGDGKLMKADDNWRDSQESEVEQTELAPSDTRESAIVASLSAGNYTAVVSGANNSGGIGLVEVYDLEPSNPAELGNLSVRADVRTGDDVLIDGIIIRGGNPKRVLFRGIGPELTGRGVANALQDPTIELHDGNGALLLGNDNWKDAPNRAEIEGTGLAPTDDRESAVLMTLSPGNYTSIVRGANDTMGVALSEAYKLTN